MLGKMPSKISSIPESLGFFLRTKAKTEAWEGREAEAAEGESGQSPKGGTQGPPQGTPDISHPTAPCLSLLLPFTPAPLLTEVLMGIQGGQSSGQSQDEGQTELGKRAAG